MRFRPKCTSLISIQDLFCEWSKFIRILSEAELEIWLIMKLWNCDIDITKGLSEFLWH